MEFTELSDHSIFKKHEHLDYTVNAFVNSSKNADKFKEFCDEEEGGNRWWFKMRLKTDDIETARKVILLDKCRPRRY